MVIVCLSSTSKGGTGALMWGDGVWGENMEMVAKMKLGGGIKILGGELNDKGEASRFREVHA